MHQQYTELEDKWEVLGVVHGGMFINDDGKGGMTGMMRARRDAIEEKGEGGRESRKGRKTQGWGKDRVLEVCRY